MALTAAQQAEADKLKAFVAEQDLLVRQSYTGMHAANGSFFFKHFADLKKLVEAIEKA